MTARRTVHALLLGNFITGSAVLAPAGMLGEIARQFGIGLAAAGLLTSLGAVVLCVCSPAMTWLTSSLDRRRLLTGAVVLMSVGQFACAAASSWPALLVARVVTMAIAAIFTPQAASTLTLIVPERERSTAIALAFLGWSVALALGVPMMSMVTSTLGWRAAYLALGGLGLVTAAVVWASVPGGLVGVRLSLANWKAILESGFMRLILLVTILTSAGQFLLVTYLRSLLAALTTASAVRITIDLAVFGIMSIVGNMIATRAVAGLGALKTSLASLAAICVGMLMLFAGIGAALAVTTGLAVWGLGFASSNSMQQARLAAAAPHLTGASIALNTSGIYVGQAVGASLGGALIAHAMSQYTFLAAGALVAVAIVGVFLSAEGRATHRA